MAYPDALRRANERRREEAAARRRAAVESYLSDQKLSPTAYAKQHNISRSSFVQELRSLTYSTTAIQYRIGPFGDPVLEGVTVEGFWRHRLAWNRINGAIGSYSMGRISADRLKEILREYRGKTYTLPPGAEGITHGQSHIGGRKYRFIDDRDFSAIQAALEARKPADWGRGIETPKG